MDTIAGISYYLNKSTNVRCHYRVVYNNFVFQQDIKTFDRVQLLQRKTLNFLIS